MAYIDSYLRVMSQIGAYCLEISGEAKPKFISTSGPREIGEILKEKQAQRIMAELMNAQSKTELGKEGRTFFEYGYENQTFKIKVFWQGRMIKGRILELGSAPDEEITRYDQEALQTVSNRSQSASAQTAPPSPSAPNAPEPVSMSMELVDDDSSFADVPAPSEPASPGAVAAPFAASPQVAAPGPGTPPPPAGMDFAQAAGAQQSVVIATGQDKYKGLDAEPPKRARPVRWPAKPLIDPNTNKDISLEYLLSRMVELKASDLHISSNAKPIYRIDGEMQTQEQYPLVSPENMGAILKTIDPELNRAEFEDTNDTDFAFEIKGYGRFRVNYFRDRHGPGAVFRQIPYKILTADQLGMSDTLKNLAQLSKGLVLVTGPTGSGKSTTLAAIIDVANRTRTDHIITIEDPIEFVHENIKCLVNQREVRTHTDGFKSALRAALREDPDIVLVGEMRDLETVSIAMETAETGHLVFGTLHTTTAIATIDRLIDIFPSDQQDQVRTTLSDSLKAVIAQNLLKRKEGGRVAAQEVLIVTNSVSNLIRENKNHQILSQMQMGKKYGMRTMDEELLRYVQKKIVSPEEAFAKAPDKISIAEVFEKNRIRVRKLDAIEPQG